MPFEIKQGSALTKEQEQQKGYAQKMYIDPTASPLLHEQQLSDQITKYSNFDPSTLDRAGLLNYAQDVGFSIPDLGQGFGGVAGSTGINEAIDDRLRKYLLNETNKRQANLSAQRTELFKNERNRRIGELTTKEAALKSQLDETSSSLQGEIDRMLSRELAELGVGAGEARREAGASLASRGLTDSSVATRYGADIATGEIEAKGKMRLQADQGKEAVEKQKTDVIKDIDRRRKQIEQAKNLQELSNAEDLSFAFDQQQFKIQTAQLLAQMEMDAESKAFTANLLGGIFGAGAGILGGQLL